MNSKIIIAVVGLGILLGSLWLIQPFNTLFCGAENGARLIGEDKPNGGDFTLNSETGSVKLSDYRGKVVMIYFGYTFCPDICPTNLSSLASAYQSLDKSQQDQVQILFISVDPERDNVKRLREYVDYFDADIIGITGANDTLQNIALRYGVVYGKVDNPENPKRYAVDHSAFTYLVDQQGQLKTQLPHATTPAQFKQAILNALPTDGTTTD